jgi:RNA polymerase sigma-70 factor, ECF subfamily
MTTTAIFVRHAPAAHHAALEAMGDLAERIEALCERARSAWPGVAFDAARFVAHVAERLPVEDAPEEALAKMHVEDLWLACAVLGGDDAAARALREACVPRMRAALAASGLGDRAEEVTEQVVAELVIPGADGRPPLARFRGAGNLAAWVKVIALRTARHARSRGQRERPAGDELVLERVSDELDPELGRLKDAYRHAFKLAFQEALAALGSRERAVLRYELVGGLNIDRIGTIFGVHRATVARWRTAARDELFEGTRRSMRAHLDISEVELDSVMRLIESRLDASLTRLLRAEASAEDGDDGRNRR